MTNNIVDIDIIKLLSGREYYYYDSKKRKPTQQSINFQQLNFFGDVYDLFDDYVAKNGIAPTMKLYVEQYKKVAKDFFTKDADFNGFKVVSQYSKNKGFYEDCKYKWNSDLANAVELRAKNSYQSYLVEWTTAQQIKRLYPDIKIIHGSTIDRVFGADLVLSLPTKKMIYVHVFSNTEWGWKGYHIKSKRKGYYDKQKTKLYWDRDWHKGHECLTFDRYETATTQIINGNVLFKDEFIKDYIDSCFECNSGDDINNTTNQLNLFFKWLHKNNIKNDWVVMK